MRVCGQPRFGRDQLRNVGIGVPPDLQEPLVLSARPGLVAVPVVRLGHVVPGEREVRIQSQEPLVLRVS